MADSDIHSGSAPSLAPVGVADEAVDGGQKKKVDSEQELKLGCEDGAEYTARAKRERAEGSSGEEDGDAAAFISIFQGQMKDLDGVTAFAVDIGGSLAKLAYYAMHSHRHTALRPRAQHALYSGVAEEQETGRLHFAVFETRYIGACLDFIQKKLRGVGAGMSGDVGSDKESGRAEAIFASHSQHVHATGGGAHKYSQLFQDKLGLRYGVEERGEKSEERGEGGKVERS